MDDSRLVEVLRGTVPATDAAARDRARLRLQASITAAGPRPAPSSNQPSPPASRRVRWPFAAAAALLALAILLFAALLPPGGVGPTPGTAAEIRRLGSVAARQEPVSLTPSEYLYQRREVQTREVRTLLSSGSSYALDIRATVESWLAENGSGRVVTTYTSVSFASDQDALAWKEAGRPPIHQAGEVIAEPYARSGLPYYRVEDLPTDPAALRDALLNGQAIDAAPGDFNLLSTIGTLLSQQNLSSDLRQALFDVAASIPNVDLERDVADPLQREAVAIKYSDDAGTTRLYFDPTDATLLSRSESIPAEGGRPATEDWQAFLEAAPVDRLGRSPSDGN